MKILIADDEPLARQRLRQLVAAWGGATFIAEAANGKETLLQANELKPDIILLDIRMPGMDGLEAAMHLSALPNPPAVIFTTAYGDHALDAFEANAVDYLLKPIRQERLRGALQKAQRLTHSQAAALYHSHERGARTHISALMHGNIQLVAVSEIRYFKADQKYVTVRFKDGQVLIEDSLKALEAEFGARFLRIHRNALVAIAFIHGMEKSATGLCEIKLQGVDEKLEISRRHLAGVRNTLRNL